MKTNDKDFINTKVGKLLILGKDDEASIRRKTIVYKCRCDCGNEILYPKYRLIKKIADGTADSLDCNECFKRDLIGSIFDDYIVEEYDEQRSLEWDKATFKCRCKNCGNVVDKSRNDLLRHRSTICSCSGPMWTNIDDFVGHIFGDLLVLSYNAEASKIAKVTLFDCKCLRCGNIKQFRSTVLKQGIVQSCGCSRTKTDNFVDRRDSNREIIKPIIYYNR